MRIHEIDKWIILYNPLAGSKKSKKNFLDFTTDLKTQCIVDIFDVTSNFLSDLFKLFRKGQDHLIIAGGDGTINKGINLLIKQNAPEKLKIFILPLGTGNDYFSFLSNNQKPKLKKIAKTLWESQALYVGKFTYLSNSKTTYFVNILGTGFDGLIANKYEQTRKIGFLKGKHGYILTMAYSLFGKINSIMRIKLGNEDYDGAHLLIAVGIGKYFGGGIMVCPHAKGTNFAITRVEQLGPLKILRNYLKLFNGRFVENDEVYQYNNKSIIIDSEQPIQADGELFEKGQIQVDLVKTNYYVYHATGSLFSP